MYRRPDSQFRFGRGGAQQTIDLVRSLPAHLWLIIRNRRAYIQISIRGTPTEIINGRAGSLPQRIDDSNCTLGEVSHALTQSTRGDQSDLLPFTNEHVALSKPISAKLCTSSHLSPRSLIHLFLFSDVMDCARACPVQAPRKGIVYDFTSNDGHKNVCAFTQRTLKHTHTRTHCKCGADIKTADNK